MNELIESIVNKQYTKADQLFHEAMNSIVSRKLNEAKKMCAAKMSVEQLNVDSQGNFHEAGGRNVILSHEKLERGLAEGDVVPLGRLEKSNSGIITHEGGKHKVVFDPKESKLTIFRDGKPQGTIEGSEAHKAHRHFMETYNNYKGDGSSHSDAVYSAALSTKDEFKPNMEANPRKADVISMKEEAKKAAIRTIQEKVRVRGEDEPPKPPLSARALRFRAALSGEKLPKPTLVKSEKND